MDGGIGPPSLRDLPVDNSALMRLPQINLVAGTRRERGGRGEEREDESGLVGSRSVTQSGPRLQTRSVRKCGGGTYSPSNARTASRASLGSSNITKAKPRLLKATPVSAHRLGRRMDAAKLREAERSTYQEDAWPPKPICSKESHD